MFCYEIEKRQTGWTCRAAYRGFISSQFTTVECWTEWYSARWAWLAFAKCWIGARQEKKVVECLHRDARKAKGWA